MTGGAAAGAAAGSLAGPIGAEDVGEPGRKCQPWRIYRTIIHERNIEEPNRRSAATELALQQVPFEKLDQNPKLKYEVELAHAYGRWEK